MTTEIVVEIDSDSDADVFTDIPPGAHKLILPGTAQFLRHLRKTPERKIDPHFADAIAACGTLRVDNTDNAVKAIKHIMSKLTKNELKIILCFMHEDGFRK